MKKTMRFEPTYTRDNRLPKSLKVIIIDEASMVATAGEGEEAYKINELNMRKEPIALFEMLTDALHPSTKLIFIGDIQQLPPVFGDSILGHSLLKVPTIELTEVYRQALDSPIISLAWHILRGEAYLFPSLMKDDPNDASGKRKVNPAFKRFEEQAKGKVSLVPWQRKLNADQALQQASRFLINLAENGGYLPEEDTVLIPFNVNFGQTELNKHLANAFGKKRGALVYEVISGINKCYLAVGDKVLFNKEEFKIIEINRNAQYLGQEPQAPSERLDRWGTYQGSNEEHHLDSLANAAKYSEADIDAYLEAAAGATSEERFNHASHTITIQNMADESIIETLGTAGEVNNLDLGYAMTVHKSQGSEYRKVFILLHHTHAVMLFRELLYTAVTRAREELVIICEPDSLQKAISNPRIKGNTIEEKAAFFNKRTERKAATRAALSDMEVNLN
jgi:ATP-dependent exoDNAse (exonuclease V) alpha subunit